MIRVYDLSVVCFPDERDSSVFLLELYKIKIPLNELYLKRLDVAFNIKDTFYICIQIIWIYYHRQTIIS